MEIPEILFGYQSITRLTLVILGLVFTYYLGQIKPKSRATWLILAAFVCMTTAFAILFLPIWANLVQPIMIFFLIVSQALLIQFGYHFPRHTQPRESHAMLLISGGFLAGVVGLGASYNYLFWRVPSAVKATSSVRGLLFLLLFLQIITTLSLLLRQTLHRIAAIAPPDPTRRGRTRYILIWQGLLHPPHRDIRLLRNLVGSLALGLLPGTAEPLYRLGLIAFPTVAFIVDLGLLLMMFAVFLTYLNGTHESVSFITRLVSIPLVTLLLLFGIATLVTAGRFNVQAEHERQLHLSFLYQALADGTRLPLSDQIVYIVTRVPSDRERPAPYRVLFARQADVDVQFLMDEDRVRQEVPGLFTPNVPVTAADEFQRATALALESLLRFDGHPAIESAQYLSYRFLHQETLYEVGFDLRAYQRTVHATVVKVMVLLLTGTLVILLAFPRFFRTTLINPIQTLLNGIKHSDTDHQAGAIPVAYEDEIGFVTRAFNTMMTSIRQAEDALHRVNTELEARVAQRTLELSQANDHLRQEVMERERAETEARSAHEQLAVQNLQLQEVNASKDTFFSIIAHDLQTPITRVLDLIRFIPENLEHLSAEELKETAKTLHSSLENFYELLKNLFTWSGIQRGTLPLHPRAISLQELVNRNLSFFIPLAEEKQVRIHNQITVEMVGYADSDMMYAVIRNLLSNALKYTFPGDHVVISSTQAEGMVDVAVADTGVGMSAEDLSHLFRTDKNYQTPGTGGEEGVGVGLLLCKELVEQNGGRLWLESELDRGTTSHFTLPAFEQRLLEYQS